MSTILGKDLNGRRQMAKGQIDHLVQKFSVQNEKV
jgi:hypothetical protein